MTAVERRTHIPGLANGGMPMTSHTPSNRLDDRAAPATVETSTAAGQLFRQLVDEVETHNPPSEAHADPITGAIILDRTVDGVRYLLLRMPSIPLCHVPLSPRESEIARMVADGYQTKVIAGVLNISCWTVTAHLRRIFVKLGVTSRAGITGKLLEQRRQGDPSGCPDSRFCATLSPIAPRAATAHASRCSAPASRER